MPTTDADPGIVQHTAAPTGPDDVGAAIPVVTKATKSQRFSKRSLVLFYVLGGIFALLVAYGFGVFGSPSKDSTLASTTPPLNTTNRTGDSQGSNAASQIDIMTKGAPTTVPPLNTATPSLANQENADVNKSKDNLSVALHDATGANGETPNPTATFDTSGPVVPPVDGANNSAGVPNPGGPAPLAGAPQTPMQSPASDEQAAHKSSIFVGDNNAGQTPGSPSPSPAADSTSTRTAGSPPVDQTGAFAPPAAETPPPATIGGASAQAAALSERIKFANGQGERPAYLGALVASPIGKYELWRGSSIPSQLDTGINTDIPGPVFAHVTNDVYDSKTGQTLVIPKGSRLQGRYNSIVSNGQTRVEVNWDYLTWPNGKWINLDAMPGAEPDGNAGLYADVNDHRGALIGASIFTALLSAGANVIGGESNGNTNINTSTGAIVGQSVGSSLAQTGQTIINEKANIPPENTVPKGKPFIVETDRTIILPAYSYSD
jgi:type IV secretion system protein VirB10